MTEPKLPHNGREIKIFKGVNNSGYILEYWEIIESAWVITAIGRVSDTNVVAIAVGKYLG
jgi:hypothetical protein